MIKNEVKKYENWIQDLNISQENFSNLVLNFLKKGLENKVSKLIKDYKFLLISKNNNLNTSLLVDFNKIKIDKIEDQNFTNYSKKIIVDPLVLCRIIRHEILWGDAYCGLSLTVDRKPYDNYNLNFWKWLYGLDALDIDYQKYFS